MTLDAQTITDPIPISVVAGRYLLYDIRAVTYVRKHHNICGVLIGSIPQVPQQNVFLGLPMELLPEEAKLLVRSGVAYIVDSVAWHRDIFSTLKGADRKKYLESLRSAGRKARQLAEESAKKRTERALAKQNVYISNRDCLQPSSLSEKSGLDLMRGVTDESELVLFEPQQKLLLNPTSTVLLAPSFTVTPTSTFIASDQTERPPQQLEPVAPNSFSLFAHLHAKGYFITPGLRFGCDYTIYPGDPLRFHSHFLAVGYGWDEDIPLVDLVGGGRLGTGVKKGFLIGGEILTQSREVSGAVRTFCIEWGGM